MDLAQDKLELIEKIIRNDRKFSNNEDLFDDFFNETCQRSLGIVNIVTSDAALEAYLKKIATTSILNVLKDSGRLRRTKSGYTPSKEITIDTSNKYEDIEVSYNNFNVTISPEEIAIQKDTIRQISAIITKIDEEDSNKQYLQIYKLRYDRQLAMFCQHKSFVKACKRGSRGICMRPKAYTDGDIDALRTIFCSSESIQIADSSQETSCQANVAEYRITQNSKSSGMSQIKRKKRGCG